MLINKGAAVNIQGGHYSTALKAACVGGHSRVTMMLIDKYADPNTDFSRYDSATTMGLEALAALLVQKGADVNARGGQYDSALQAACVKGP